MSKKGKRAVLESTISYGIDVCEDAKAKARLKYQTLMQDYDELQKETGVMRSKLEASQERKRMLAAEVRFLRRRYEFLMKTRNTTSSTQEQGLVHAPNSLKRTKIVKEQPLIRKEASRHKLPIAPEPISKKKRVASPDDFQVSDQPRKKKSYSRKEAKGHGLFMISPLVSDLNHRGVMHIRKDILEANTNPILDRHPKERMLGENDATLSSSAAAFDLNLETSPSERDVSLPTRALIFDLNEISTGDDDFQGSMEANKFDDARKSLMRSLNEEQQSDLKLSICRNAGESSSRAGKRKISWQDPVALQV